MLPMRRSTRATCRGRPRCRHLAAPKCHCRAGHGRRGDKTMGSSSRQAASPARVEQQSVRSRAAPSGTGAPESQRSAPRQAGPLRRSEERSVSARQLYDGSDRPDSDSLQRRRSRGRSLDSGMTPSMPPVAEPSAAPRRLQSLLIRGGRALDVHMSLVARGGQGPSPIAAEARGIAPERMGESAAAAEAAGRSGAVPETAGPRRAAPEQGSKHTDPEKGLSDRPVKKARVRSKMQVPDLRFSSLCFFRLVC
jgi:hypothetical protein